MMGLCYLLTLYWFIRGAASDRPRLWYSLCVTSCALGMASKEVMVSAPLMVLLYDRAFLSGTFGEAWRRRWRLYLALGSTWILLGYLVAAAGGRGGSAGFGVKIIWWQYALTQSRAITHYLWLSVWPHPLVFDYGEFMAIQHITEVLPSALVVVVLAASVLFALRRRPAIGFVGAWFFLILAPTSSVVPIGSEPMAEHRMYLPLAAVVTLVVIGIDSRLGRRRVAVFLAAAVGLGLLTARRNEDYRTAVSIWNDTVAKCPENARAHSNLGRVLLTAGQLPAAMAQCEQALRTAPDNPETYFNLGLILQQMGRPREAIGEYEQALRIKPDHFGAHYNLGVALENVGREPEAIDHYERALQINPDDAEAHYNLGNDFLREGKVSDAVGHYEQALRIKSDYAEAHSNLGIALAQTGKIEEAIAHYEQALRIKPDYAEAHNNLGTALAQTGKIKEAIAHYEQALRIKPDYTQAQNALARLQAGQ
jgi:tetratricopeptide (TPR) repeat protein